MGAIFGAGFDGWLAMGGVGTDGCEEDGGFAGEVAELGFVEVADFDCCDGVLVTHIVKKSSMRSIGR